MPVFQGQIKKRGVTVLHLEDTVRTQGHVRQSMAL